MQYSHLGQGMNPRLELFSYLDMETVLDLVISQDILKYMVIEWMMRLLLGCGLFSHYKCVLDICEEFGVDEGL